MASIVPFRALRPTPASAACVAAVPYDVVSVEDARALAAGNPLSFLHVSRAEIDRPAGTDPYADTVYEAAARNFARLTDEAPLVVEDAPSLYCYRLRMGAHEQTGLAACYSLNDYDRDVIKKHERTRRDKEDDRTRHMLALRAQTGPVFLTYRASREIDAAARRVQGRVPLFDFEAPDRVRHTVWRVVGDEMGDLIQAFQRLPALYIADGHHRAASAARARDYWRAQPNRVAVDRSQPGGVPGGASIGGPGGLTEIDTFLAVAFPDDQVQILPYNRVVKDLAGLSPDRFLAAVGARVALADGPPAPARRGQVSMFLGGRWRTIDLHTIGGSSAAHGSGALDVSLLQEGLLEPVLKIADVRTDKRIEFVGGLKGPAELERLVSQGQAAVAFSLFPVGVEDLMRIADEGGIMPPKSTWFEPKLRDGLLIHGI